MLPSVLIIIVSAILLVYWFRYSCLLLLRNGAAAQETAPNEQFQFAEVLRRIPEEKDLDPLHAALRRDYQVLMFLVQHAPGLGQQSLEDRLLALDYRVMQWRYRLTRVIFPSQARGALREMASVIGVLSRRMGEQAGLYSRV